MPKVKRSRKPPPDGWELIEPTLDELDQKMREGETVPDDLDPDSPRKRLQAQRVAAGGETVPVVTSGFLLVPRLVETRSMDKWDHSESQWPRVWRKPSVI